MAVLRYRMHRMNKLGAYDTLHLETDTTVIARPNGHVLEDDLLLMEGNLEDHTHSANDIDRDILDITVGGTGVDHLDDSAILGSAAPITSNAVALALQMLNRTIATLQTDVHYAGTTPPDNKKLLWIDTGNGSVIKYWNGSTWANTHALWYT